MKRIFNAMIVTLVLFLTASVCSAVDPLDATKPSNKDTIASVTSRERETRTKVNEIITNIPDIANWEIVTGSASPTSGDKLAVDTAAIPCTITLPTSPATGAFIYLTDPKTSWGTNNVTLERSGEKINGASANYTLSSGGLTVTLIYTGTAYGWGVANMYVIGTSDITTPTNIPGLVSGAQLQTASLRAIQRTNVQTLSGNTVISYNDAPVQVLDPNGADRDVTLPDPTLCTYRTFFVANTGSGVELLNVKDFGSAQIRSIRPSYNGTYYSDGISWREMNLNAASVRIGYPVNATQLVADVANAAMDTIQLSGDVSLAAPLTVTTGKTYTAVSGAVLTPNGNVLTFADGSHFQGNGERMFNAASGEVVFPVDVVENPYWRGVIGDGSTNSGAIVRTIKGAGVKEFPYSTSGYVIGDGATVGQAMYPESHSIWRANGAKFLHRAKNDANQGRMINVGNATTLVSDVELDGFWIDGEDEVRMGVYLTGSLERIKVRNMHVQNCGTYAITYGQAGTMPALDPLLNYYNGILLENILVDGTSVAGDETVSESGIDIFPRAQSGTDPVAFDMTWRNVKVDVTNGETNEALHGAVAMKLNNLWGFKGSDLVARGGNVNAFAIGNGTRDVQIDRLTCEKANRGITITGNHHTTVLNTSETQNIKVNNYSYWKKGVTGADDWAIALCGTLDGISFNGFDIEGTIMFYDISDTDVAALTEVIDNVTLSDGVFRGGRLELRDADFVTAAVTGVHGRNLSFLGLAGSTAMSLYAVNRQMDDSVFETIYVNPGKVVGVINGGDRNTFKDVTIVDGNVADTSGSSILKDYGDNTVLDGATLSGTHWVDYFVQKLGGSGLTVKNLRGTPDKVNGFDFQNQETSKVPQGDILIQGSNMDLSGSAVDETVFVAVEPTYVLGVSMIYTETSSADAGDLPAITVCYNGAAKITTASEASKAAGYTVNWINTTGTNSFASRYLAPGDRLSITMAGGKTGAGKVKMQVSAVTSQL